MKSLTLPPLFVSPNPFRCVESLMIARLIRRYASSFSGPSTVFSPVLNTCGKLSALNTDRVRDETLCVDLCPDLTISSSAPHRIPYISRTRATSGSLAVFNALSLVLYSALYSLFFSVRPRFAQTVIHISKGRSFLFDSFLSQRVNATAEKLSTLFFLHTGSSKLILCVSFIVRSNVGCKLCRKQNG